MWGNSASDSQPYSALTADVSGPAAASVLVTVDVCSLLQSVSPAQMHLGLLLVMADRTAAST